MEGILLREFRCSLLDGREGIFGKRRGLVRRRNGSRNHWRSRGREYDLAVLRLERGWKLVGVHSFEGLPICAVNLNVRVWSLMKIQTLQIGWSSESFDLFQQPHASCCDRQKRCIATSELHVHRGLHPRHTLHPHLSVEWCMRWKIPYYVHHDMKLAAPWDGHSSNPHPRNALGRRDHKGMAWHCFLCCFSHCSSRAESPNPPYELDPAPELH